MGERARERFTIEGVDDDEDGAPLMEPDAGASAKTAGEPGQITMTVVGGETRTPQATASSKLAVYTCTLVTHCAYAVLCVLILAVPAQIYATQAGVIGQYLLSIGVLCVPACSYFTRLSARAAVPTMPGGRQQDGEKEQRTAPPPGKEDCCCCCPGARCIDTFLRVVVCAVVLLTLTCGALYLFYKTTDMCEAAAASELSSSAAVASCALDLWIRWMGAMAIITAVMAMVTAGVTAERAKVDPLSVQNDALIEWQILGAASQSTTCGALAIVFKVVGALAPGTVTGGVATVMVAHTIVRASLSTHALRTVVQPTPSTTHGCTGRTRTTRVLAEIVACISALAAAIEASRAGHGSGDNGAFGSESWSSDSSSSGAGGGAARGYVDTLLALRMWMYAGLVFIFALYSIRYLRRRTA